MDTWSGFEVRILIHVCCAPCFAPVHESLTSSGHEVMGFFYNPNIHPYQEYLRRLHCLERYTALRPVEVIYDKEYDLDKYLVGALQAKYDPPPDIKNTSSSTDEVGRTTRNNSAGGFKEEIKVKDSLSIKLIPRSEEDNDGSAKEITIESSLGPPRDTLDTAKNTKSKPQESPARCRYCINLRLTRTAEMAAKNGFDAFTTTLLESKYQPHEYIRDLGDKLANKYGIRFYYEDFRTGWKKSIKLSKELELYRQQYCGCIFSEYERFGPQDR